MSKMESVYYRVLLHWYSYRKYSPSASDLAALCKPRKSVTAVRSALLSLETKGYVCRNEDGQFEVSE